MSDMPHLSGPEPTDPEDRRIADLLGGALHREAARVSPSPDGLQRIQRELRSRTVPRPAAWFGRLAPALTAAAAVAVLAVAGTVGVRLTDRPSAGGAGPATAPSVTAEAPPDKLPVYVVGDQGGRRWLFREYRSTHARTADERVAEAVTDAVTLAPADLDYDVRLFEGALPGQARAQVSDQLITLTLTAAMATRPGATTADAELAVQQLVWTATATAGPGYASTPVRITVANGEQSLFGRLPLDRTFTRGAGSTDPRAPIWVISLADRTDVGHRPITVSGDAVLGSGGSVSWTLARDGVEVARGTAQVTSHSGSRTGWTFAPDTTASGQYLLTVTLHPGSGTRLPSTSTPWQDSKTFRVS
ncbi:MAG TPA: hypothetical protein VFP72_21785 [Kineosporiaceae bacterium]|nr:hypothetical protein [Kineosporiaceae bacterium]